MCDHSYVLAGALRGVGIDAETLPVSNDESLDLGLRHSSGKECIPFSLTTGDIVKKIGATDFKPDESSFFMPTTGGPCRFGQYQRLQKIILEEMGHPDIPLYSPDSDAGYNTGEGLSLGANFRRAAWRGVVVIDILDRLLHETRPHELNKGETDRVYGECLDEAARLVEKDSGLLFKYVWDIRNQFKNIAIDRTSRPSNRDSRRDIFAQSFIWQPEYNQAY